MKLSQEKTCGKTTTETRKQHRVRLLGYVRTIESGRGERYLAANWREGQRPLWAVESLMEKKE
jgi:hypothetical protein